MPKRTASSREKANRGCSVRTPTMNAYHIIVPSNPDQGSRTTKFPCTARPKPQSG